jgi:Fic family protein
MFSPKYRITTEILKNVSAIEAAREVILNAPLIPAWESRFRQEAKMKAAHYGTALEGNDLTFNEAKIIVERGVLTPEEAAEVGVVARDRDVQEVINYRNVLDFIERLVPGERFGYSKELILEMHKLVTDKIILPDQTGAFRQVQVVLRNSITGEVGFRPPASEVVQQMLDEFLEWLNGEVGKREHPVIRAAVAHYVLAAVHPFVEGNGRTARAITTLILSVEAYDVKKFFALEEYFDNHAEEYFGSLMEVSNQSERLEDRDITPWLETFSRALAIELTRIKEQVRNLSVDIKIKEQRGEQVALTERQMKLVEYLQSNGEMGMAEARGVLPMVSEDTILREVRYLMDKGVIEKRGSTKAAKYVLLK